MPPGTPGGSATSSSSDLRKDRIQVTLDETFHRLPQRRIQQCFIPQPSFQLVHGLLRHYGRWSHATKGESDVRYFSRGWFQLDVHASVHNGDVVFATLSLFVAEEVFIL